jgi:hypothetical protein
MSSVRVNISRSDLLKVNIGASAKHISTWIGLGFSIAVFASLPLWQYGLDAVMHRWGVWLAIAFGGGIGAWLVLMLLSFACLLLMTRRGDGILGEHIYTVTDNGLVESTVANETLLRWGTARWLSRSAYGIYIHVTGFVTHVIPRRAFESDAAYDAFWRELAPLAKRDA